MNPTNLFSNLISTLNRKKFKCIILQLPDEIFLTSSKKKYQEKLKEIEKLSKILFNSLSDNGILWIFVNDVYHNGMLKKTSFDISQILSCSSFLIRNMIIWYGQHKKYSRDLTDFYSTIIFAVKNNNYDFNLDPVRESHIWKDFEWGGGRRSRYNPKGKNPSNLWLKTHSEKGKTKYHIPLSTEMAFERCLLLSDIDKESSLIFSFKKYSKLDKKFTKSISWLNIPKFEIESVKQQIVSKKLNQKKISHAVHNKIINKSSECMKEIENDMVQLIVTSPPYWGLRDYNSKNQIGYKDTYQEYLVRLQLVWKECFRVLRESGTLWVNIGKRLINDNMLLIANDIINSASEVGFTLKDIVIWHKPVFVPTSGKNNLTDRYEHVLFFAKNKKNIILTKKNYKILIIILKMQYVL